VAAASYYLVGLVAHVAAGLARLGVRVDPEVAAAVSAPAAVMLVVCILWRRAMTLSTGR
jgi:uncharacterized membrane-anchored protein